MSIDGVKIRTIENFGWAIASRKPSTIIRYKGKRHGIGYTRKIVIRGKAFLNLGMVHVADQFEAGINSRSEGFEKVFIHDAKLYPSECGGPVFDSEGRFMGINIARTCRVSSVAIPAEEVRGFVKNALKL